MEKAIVIGAGLAGCEAAWQIANRGIQVDLYEMKPNKKSPAHHHDYYAELVCSNSLRSDAMTNAVGVMKEEMRMLNSLIMEAADATRVPAGSALAVDREGFSNYITDKIKNHPNIHIIEEEVTKIPEGNVVIASGPLTSDDFAVNIQKFLGEEYFHFFDAAAPIIEKDSIDFSKAYYKARYDKGDKDYINCPMTREEFDAFYQAVITAEKAELHEFEGKETYFEGCMPFEEMARRGQQTLLFGPMKPVGLETPEGKRPYAVVQLRQDNAVGTLYNIVGFQTHLKWPEQKRVLRMIPGLENCEIVRYGVMHRNSYINSPTLLNPTYECRKRKGLFFAGQMTGVEGYVESSASGLIAGINLAREIRGMDPIALPATTVIGSQAQYISKAVGNFQPMNANFGIMTLDVPVKRKSERKEAYGKQALEVMTSYKEDLLK